MRTAITIGIHHGGEKTSLITGAEVSVSDQLAGFKKLPEQNQPHEKFERIEVWESDSGKVRSRTYITKKAFDDREASLKKQREEHEKAKDEEAKRNKGEPSDKKAAKEAASK